MGAIPLDVLAVERKFNTGRFLYLFFFSFSLVSFLYFSLHRYFDKLLKENLIGYLNISTTII